MLVLRDFTADDDAALICWARNAEELRLFAGPSLAFPLTPPQLQALRDAPDVTTWTACLAGAPDVPVGHAELVRTGPDTGRLARIVLDPARRGTGLGRALVTAALEQTERLGLRTVDLNVYAGNTLAIRIYTALGFLDAGPLPSDEHVRVLVRASPR